MRILSDAAAADACRSSGTFGTVDLGVGPTK
jgi:hypothetical protein